MPEISVLGVSAYFHDSSAALVRAGEIVAAAAEERFSRLKHDSNFPRLAIRYCLEEAGLEAQDLDAVVFYEDPHVKFTRVLASTLAGFPRSRRRFVGAMQQWLGHKLWVHNELSAALDVHPAKVRCLPHHDSHAAQAFLASPFGEAAVLTLDAVGEWTCTAIARGRSDGGRRVEVLEAIPYPHSLGLVYAAFTAFLGFRPNDSEASTMALAAFGEPRYQEQVRRIVRVASDGTYSVDTRFFDFLSHDGALFRPAFVELLGAPRHFREELPFDALCDEAGAVPPEMQRWADVAASVQAVLEEAVLGLARRAQRLTGLDRLCLAGGVALNAVANTRVIEQAGFKEVFIPPDPGDGGAALGAALLEYYRRSGEARPPAISPFLGRAFHEAPLEPLLEHADPADWRPYGIEGARPLERSQLETLKFDDLDALVAQVVADLTAGRVVGWFQSRFEIGPRALGNRSILADPRDLEAVRRLSRHVKKRASFRPYALALREEDAARLFELNGHIPRCARWMQMVKPVREELLAEVRGAVHCDRTTRLQVCSPDDNPRFHRLLSAFARARGLGALLNTSFNDPGYPIVASPHEALLVFARTDMDSLVVGDLLIRKRRP